MTENAEEIEQIRSAFDSLTAGKSDSAEFKTLVRQRLADGSFTRLGVETVLRAVAPPSSASSRSFASLLGVANSSDTLSIESFLQLLGVNEAEAARPNTNRPPTVIRSVASVNEAEQFDTPRSNPFSTSSESSIRYPAAAIGSLLDQRYLLERKLGEGGMGVVYFARDQKVEGEIFAIKVLKHEIRMYPEAIELVREEVRKTRSLAHPNIVGMYSLDSDPQEVFILMEYLEGKPLSALLDEEFGRGMPFDRAWPLIRDICTGLAYAHDHSVIHSDLKPSNIFILTSGKAKLLDFGIARAARGGKGRVDPAQLGALTPAYASCEMLEGGKPDQRDDVYSLACVIYEMLSGKLPFDRPSAIEARQDRLKPALIKSLTGDQNSALARGLTFERSGRTETVEALLADLGRAPPPPPPPPATVPLWIAIIVVSIVGIAWWGLHSNAPRPPTASTATPSSETRTTPATMPQPSISGADSDHSAAQVTGPQQPTDSSQLIAPACQAAPSATTLDAALNAALQAKVALTLYPNGTRRYTEATADLERAVLCLRSLERAGFRNPNSEKFLEENGREATQ